MGYVLG